MTPLQIEHRPIAALRAFATNARTHSKKQLRQIADSIEEFGFTNPVLVDEHGTILAGHGRVEAARMLGRTEVPCVRLAAMTETQKRAYVLADNKLALNAGWDEDLLASELGVLLEEGFDVGLTGFAIGEVDALLQLHEPEAAGDPADDALPDAAPRRVRPGDLWQLGPHPAPLRRRARRRGRGAPDGRRARAGGVHRSPLQRADPGPCGGIGQDQAPRVRHGFGRDEPGRVHGLPHRGLP